MRTTALLINSETQTFDTSEIKRGDVIRLGYDSKDEAKNGIVARVTPTELTIFYLPGTANVTNYIILKAEDAQEWASIIWTEDMETINSFEGEEESEDTDGTA